MEESEVADDVRRETNAISHVCLDPGLGDGNGLLGLLTSLPDGDRGDLVVAGIDQSVIDEAGLTRVKIGRMPFSASPTSSGKVPLTTS